VAPAMARRIFAVWRAESARRPSVQAFVDTLRAQWSARHGQG
jgi:DNA-binding transcriptional LysR family regulator